MLALKYFPTDSNDLEDNFAVHVAFSPLRCARAAHISYYVAHAMF
jgi:hypothetical protein